CLYLLSQQECSFPIVCVSTEVSISVFHRVSISVVYIRVSISVILSPSVPIICGLTECPTIVFFPHRVFYILMSHRGGYICVNHQSAYFCVSPSRLYLYLHRVCTYNSVSHTDCPISRVAISVSPQKWSDICGLHRVAISVSYRVSIICVSLRREILYLWSYTSGYTLVSHQCVYICVPQCVYICVSQSVYICVSSVYLCVITECSISVSSQSSSDTLCAQQREWFYILVSHRSGLSVYICIPTAVVYIVLTECLISVSSQRG
ncbi:uncharacterized protein LOC124374948, partial [Homalodisca vitripennis]|uniref:uncharacterized protein LOC124374948 n=1 Tax=Homalodisca vitripennis TaxID=197043 RepID=UPI001EEC1E39